MKKGQTGLPSFCCASEFDVPTVYHGSLGGAESPILCDLLLRVALRSGETSTFQTYVLRRNYPS